jgi:outer membrane protein assembly factor BamB
VHITAYCPECQSRYQLKADLLGRKMRCKTPSCQAIFVIHAASGGIPRNGSDWPRAADARGDLVVPLADGSLEPVEELDWRAAPPPVQSVIPVGKPVAPPPARRTPPPTPPPPPPPVTKVREWEQPEPPARHRGWILVGLAVLILGVAGYGVSFVIRAYAQDETARREAAAKDYADGRFRAAAKKYYELAEKYGGGEHGAEYHLLADLSDLQDAAAASVADPAAALAQAQAFVKKYEARDPAVKPHRDAVSLAIVAIVRSFADAANAAATTEDGPANVPELVRQGREAIDLLRGYPPKDPGQFTALQERFDKAGEALAKAQEHSRAVADVRKLLDGRKPDVTAARRLAQQRQVADDPGVRRAIAQAEEQSLHEVVYRPMIQPPQPTGPADGPPALLLETTPHRKPDGPAADVVFAVARGILYALDGRDGRRLWACRVGLDSGELPARVPPIGDGPELILVASSDPPGLTARDARTGSVLWHQPLDAPCLGRPVREAAGRLFVPTTGPRGIVYDLDARTGVIRGRFDAGQPFAGGGAFDAVTQRLYVPAHGLGVFVFNYGVPEAAARLDNTSGPRFEGLLPTGHPAGSLRGEPIVITGEQEGPEVARYLVLGQADGLDAMTLRAFRLLADPVVSPVKAEIRLPGWSWFPPYHDPETIALVTDAGAIGLFGIQQKGDFDPPLFPLVGEAGARGPSNPNSSKPARALLVNASESGFWVLADGVLRHWRLGLTRQSGRQLTPAFGDGIRLGSPLHAAQVSADRRTLFLVTQTDAPPAYRVTAVDGVSGQVIWQRPLGLTPDGDPVALGGAVVVLDQSGAIYRFEPGAGDAKDPWQAGGQEIAKPEPDLAGLSWLLPAADGKSAWAFSVRPDEPTFRLLLRHIAADGTLTATSTTVPAPLAGPPALTADAAVMPLADGQLFRVMLDTDNPRPALGPTWRATAAGASVRGSVARWREDQFLVSDGGRRLLRLSWGAKYELDMRQPLELVPRIAHLVACKSGGTDSAAVADVSGTVTLVRGDRPTAARSWRLGPVTAGPWAIGDRLAVVVDRKKFVWLNPDADQPVWTYTTPGDGIDFPPRVIDGKLVVADLAGRFIAIDPATGKAAGNGYQFPAEAAPTSVVTPFGPGRLFAPLTDGSVLLLRLKELN